MGFGSAHRKTGQRLSQSQYDRHDSFTDVREANMCIPRRWTVWLRPLGGATAGISIEFCGAISTQFCFSYSLMSVTAMPRGLMQHIFILCSISVTIWRIARSQHSNACALFLANSGRGTAYAIPAVDELLLV